MHMVFMRPCDVLAISTSSCDVLVTSTHSFDVLRISTLLKCTLSTTSTNNYIFKQVSLSNQRAFWSPVEVGRRSGLTPSVNMDFGQYRIF